MMMKAALPPDSVVQEGHGPHSLVGEVELEINMFMIVNRRESLPAKSGPLIHYLR